MTPYRERREQGFYNPKGEKPESTTTDDLHGLGAPHETPPEPEAEPEVEPAAEPEAESIDLEELTKSELLNLARAQGIRPANAAMSKAELIEGLTR